MSNEVDFQEIISPSEEYKRTENLWLLYNELRKSPNMVIDDNIKEFLNIYVTKDFKQAALVGLILLLLQTAPNDDVSFYARLFPILYLDYERELRQAAVEAMPAISPEQLYDEIANITIYGNPRSAAYHYAYWVLSHIDPDSLKKEFKEYL